jgi:hypothetical protein
MIEISFEVGGRKIRPNQIKNTLERAVFEQVRDDLPSQVGDVRDPETGAVPKCK